MIACHSFDVVAKSNHILAPPSYQIIDIISHGWSQLSWYSKKPYCRTTPAPMQWILWRNSVYNAVQTHLPLPCNTANIEWANEKHVRIGE
jgi:hypothetical protein